MKVLSQDQSFQMWNVTALYWGWHARSSPQGKLSAKSNLTLTMAQAKVPHYDPMSLHIIWNRKVLCGTYALCNSEARLFLGGSRAPGSWPPLPEYNAKGGCFVYKLRVPRTGPVEGKATVYEHAIKIQSSQNWCRVGYPNPMFSRFIHWWARGFIHTWNTSINVFVCPNSVWPLK